MRGMCVRCVVVLAIANIVVAQPGASQAAVQAGDAPITRVLAALEGDRATAVQQVGGIRASMTLRPESWPRARVDSLAAGIVALLLDERHDRMTSHFTRILVSRAGDGRTVGSGAQMVLLAEAAGSRDRLRREEVHRRMVGFTEDLAVIDWLVGVVTSSDPDIREVDRTSAVRTLAMSGRGQARLRLIHAQDQARGPRARAVLRDLIARDFGGGGGSGLTSMVSV